jgi:transcriptional regulator with XRE-family HTH domain
VSKARKIKPLSVQLSEILQRRRLAGEKYKDIAAKAGVHPTQVSRLANQDAGVSLCVLDKIGTYLGLVISEVEDGTNSPRGRGEEGRPLEVAAYLDWLKKEEKQHAERVWEEARRRLMPSEVDTESPSDR